MVGTDSRIYRYMCAYYISDISTTEDMGRVGERAGGKGIRGKEVKEEEGEKGRLRGKRTQICKYMSSYVCSCKNNNKLLSLTQRHTHTNNREPFILEMDNI